MHTTPSKNTSFTPEMRKNVKSICNYSKVHFHINEQQLGDLLGLGRNWKQNMFTSKKEGILRYKEFMRQQEDSSFFYEINLKYFNIWYEQRILKKDNPYNINFKITDDNVDKFLDIGLELSYLGHYKVNPVKEEMLSNHPQCFIKALQWLTVLLIHEYFLLQKNIYILKEAKNSRNAVALENTCFTKFFSEEELMNCIIKKQPQAIQNCATKNQCCNGHYCKSYLNNLCLFNSVKEQINTNQKDILHYQKQYSFLAKLVNFISPEFDTHNNLIEQIDELIAANII